MSNNININTNQNPYFDDYDENKNFHQVLYKPSLPVQARELTTQQSMLRNQIKRFGDHIFKNGSKVSGGELVLNTDYEYVKLKPLYNNVAIDVSAFEGKTIVGSSSGTRAQIIGHVAADATTGDQDTVFVKYITGGATSNSVQAIRVDQGGNGYTSEPTVTLTGGGASVTTPAEAVAVISSGSVIGVNVTVKGTGYTEAPTVSFSGGDGAGADATATLVTSPHFAGGERVVSTDQSVAADVIDGIPQNIQIVKIDNGGAGYTAAPTVTITPPTTGTQATAVATIESGVVTEVVITDDGSGYETAPTVSFSAPPAGGVTATGSTELATPTGTGSSVSISEGVFYVNGNFIKTAAQTLILEKYSNTPSYRVGITAVETVVDSGADTTLLDNAQGSSNFAAPGADRLKLILNLTKKTLSSIDDSDFYEILRVNKGIKEKDIKVPIYSVIEKTMARRTYDESGSYTVRAFNIQLKDHPSDGNKFLVRLDPGKAFVEGYEYETIISTDVEVDRARTFVNVNNFDRLMQYGNYAVTTNYFGSFDISAHATVHLHKRGASNTGHASIDVTTNTTYANTKIGTAKVRNIDYISGTGTAKIINMYLYDIRLSSDEFGDIDSIVIPEDENSSPVKLTAKTDIANAGRVGGLSSGDAKLFETNDNTMVFKLPQDVIKTIRDKDGNIDTSYTIRRVFKNQQFANGQATISTAGINETFKGTGPLSDSNKLEFYMVAVTDTTSSTFSVGDIVDMTDANGFSITVDASGQQAVIDTTAANGIFEADIIATINIDTKQERPKTLVSHHAKTFPTPNTTSLGYDMLAKSDVLTLQAVYESTGSGTAPTLPTLNITATAEALLPGEVITGITSGAKGTVIECAANSATITYVPTSGTFVSENVTGSQTGFTKEVGSVAAGDTDIKDKYILDTGQRDNFYDHGRLQLKSGVVAPTGQITAVFDYFTHSGVGYISVDSYTASVGFDNVPKYESPVTGDEVELRDCIDFRPRRTDDSTTIENIELPIPNSNWSADYSYYVPRTDTVYVSKERKFGNNKGIPSFSTTPPPKLTGTMDLYTIFIPAYTFKSKDVTARYIENKRYTMRDIGKLEKRISNLEYYTSLSLLEQETENYIIKDTAGLDRFKNGFLIDGFNGHSVGNVLSPDYKCAIDFDEKILRPSFNSNICDLQYDEAASTGVTKFGDLVTLPYTIKPLVNQPVASQAINVNPFAVLAWVGSIDLTPPSDNWIDTATQPEVIVNIQGENDAWERLTGLSWGTQFNDWQTFGTGRERVTESSTITERAGRGWPIRRRTTQTVVQEQNQSRTGIRNEITGTDTVRNSIGDRITDVSVIPFIRSRELTVEVKGLKPNTRVYARFDSEPVDDFCKPAGGANGDPIFTDDSGAISGLIFTIPNSDTLRFRTGERQFLLSDNTSGDLIAAGTYAEVTYAAQGLLQTKEEVIVSTRVPRVQSFGMGSATEFRTTTNSFTRVNVGGWFDPLAETFLVDESLYPDGVFLSDIDLFFKSKDDDGLPITVQIRDTINGYPARIVLPFSDVTLNPDQVNLSEDCSVATKFTFPSLVYLEPGEYAVVVLSNSLKYEAWIAEMGANIIGTDRKISEQPYAGVFFKSQNASTWSPDQNQDLTFILNMVEFTTGATAEAVFKEVPPSEEYKADIIQIVPQEVRMNNTTAIWSVKMTDNATNNLDAEFFEVVENQNYQLESRKKIKTTGDSYVAKARLFSNNKFISPMIDTARNSIITIENIVNNLSTNETNTSGGDSAARYITRRVNLKDGFDATSLTTYMTANRQSGTSIKVYYKVLSQYDETTFEDRPWTEMKEKTNTNSVSGSDNPKEFLELEFVPNNAQESTSYIDANNVTYSSFKTFAIKIVMNSIEETRVPLIRDLRCIALA